MPGFLPGGSVDPVSSCAWTGHSGGGAQDEEEKLSPCWVHLELTVHTHSTRPCDFLAIRPARFLWKEGCQGPVWKGPEEVVMFLENNVAYSTQCTRPLLFHAGTQSSSPRMNSLHPWTFLDSL